MKSLKITNLELNEERVLKKIKSNFDKISPYFYKMNLEWQIDAYSVFKDIDKYIILIYLINKDFDFHNRNNINISFENFYKDKTLKINKINLSNISNDLNIPKETTRRKIIELQKLGVIIKNDKKIYIDNAFFLNSKPIKTVQNASILLSQINKIFYNNKLINTYFSSTEINSLIKKKFTIIWYNYYKFILLYFNSWKKYLGDLEAFIIVTTIGANSNHDSIKNLFGIKTYLEQWRKEMQKDKETGINAMSLSEITGIPRSTVIRKVKYLIKMNIISMNKKKLLNIKLNNKTKKEVYKIQDNNLKNLSEFVFKTFNTIF